MTLWTKGAGECSGDPENYADFGSRKTGDFYVTTSSVVSFSWGDPCEKRL